MLRKLLLVLLELLLMLGLLGLSLQQMFCFSGLKLAHLLQLLVSLLCPVLLQLFL